jgi:hypothetical protein
MQDLEPFIHATRALIEFCEDHDYPVGGLEPVRRCHEALKRDDVVGAVVAFKSAPLGGMGCFNDWIPVPKHANQTPQNLADMFEVVMTKWTKWSWTMKCLAESR